MATAALDSTATLVGGVHHIFVAAFGSTMPTGIGASPGASLDNAFSDLGYTADSGSSFGVDTQSTDLYASQSYDPIRTIITSRKATVTAPLIEWNEDSIITAFGGGAITSVTGGWKYTPPTAGNPTPVSVVVDILDGDVMTRIALERGLVVGSVEATFSKSAFATLPISISALAPVNQTTSWYLVGTSASLNPNS